MRQNNYVVHQCDGMSRSSTPRTRIPQISIRLATPRDHGPGRGSDPGRPIAPVGEGMARGRDGAQTMLGGDARRCGAGSTDRREPGDVGVAQTSRRL
jgi:hypothetical protein